MALVAVAFGRWILIDHVVGTLKNEISSLVKRNLELPSPFFHVRIQKVVSDLQVGPHPSPLFQNSRL